MINKTRFITFLFSLLFCCSIYSQEKALLGGISKISIIPNKKEIISNKTVHDSLYAKTIILDNKKNKIAFIIVDSQGIAQFILEEVKRNIEKATSFPYENIVIASTHTHSGIIANSSPENFKNQELTTYQKFLVDQLLIGFQAALKDLEPIKIAWGNLNKPEHVFNRRWYTKDLQVNPFGILDSVKMNPGSALRNQLIKPAGPTDPQINFIAINNLDNIPKAILANYSLHYVGDVKSNELSADYFGAFDLAINKKLNNGSINSSFIGIMSNGTSGDINNHDYSHPLPYYDNYKKIVIVAEDIANAIAEKYRTLDFKNWIPINVDYYNLKVSPRSTNNNVESNYNKIKNNKLDKKIFHIDEKYFSIRLDYYKETYTTPFYIPLQAIQLGDLAISTVPFEVFAETGLELKKRNPFQYSFTIGLANGHWGYLPTPEQHKKGGYETWLTVNRVEENTSRIITETLLTMFNKLKIK